MEVVLGCEDGRYVCGWLPVVASELDMENGSAAFCRLFIRLFQGSMSSRYLRYVRREGANLLPGARTAE